MYEENDFNFSYKNYRIQFLIRIILLLTDSNKNPFIAY